MNMTKWLHLTAWILLMLPQATTAQVVQDSIPQLMRIDVEEHLGEYVPFDLTFTDDRGQEVRLGDYFNHQH